MEFKNNFVQSSDTEYLLLITWMSDPRSFCPRLNGTFARHFLCWKLLQFIAIHKTQNENQGQEFTLGPPTYYCILESYVKRLSYPFARFLSKS